MSYIFKRLKNLCNSMSLFPSEQQDCQIKKSDSGVVGIDCNTTPPVEPKNNNMIYSDLTVFFRHGIAFRTSPALKDMYLERDKIDQSCKYSIDGKIYDLRNRDSIYDIPVPKYNCADLGESVFYLEYVLRKHAGRLEKAGEIGLAIACLGKANQIMLRSPLIWKKKDYYRIVTLLEKNCMLSHADEWIAWIDTHVVEDRFAIDHFQEVLSECKRFKTDLVYISWAGGQSGAVAKYQGRVYSLTGKSKNFPVLPDFITERGCVIPPNEGLVSGPVILYNNSDLDTIYYKNEKVPYLKASWRPFVDDRDDEEKQSYVEIQKKIIADKRGPDNLSRLNRLRAYAPDDFPKSLSTVIRWETSKPDKYQRMLDIAKELNMPFPDFSDPIIVEPKDPDPDYCGGCMKPFFV